MGQDDKRERISGEPPEDGGDDELRARFPDPDRDERLQASAAAELPPVPEVTFSRPNTQTARGGGQTTASGAGSGGGQGAAPGALRNLGVASTIGFSLVGSIAAGTLLGWLADRYILHSAGTPWGLIVGFFAGVLSGFINLIRATNRLNQ